MPKKAPKKVVTKASPKAAVKPAVKAVKPLKAAKAAPAKAVKAVSKVAPKAAPKAEPKAAPKAAPKVALKAAPKAVKPAAKKGRGRVTSPSGPLSTAVVSVLKRVKRPLRAGEITEALLKKNYIFTHPDPKRILSIRIYKLKGVKQTGPGLFTAE